MDKYWSIFYLLLKGIKNTEAKVTEKGKGAGKKLRILEELYYIPNPTLYNLILMQEPCACVVGPAVHRQHRFQGHG